MALYFIAKKPGDEIEIFFDFSKEIVNKIKNISGRRWIPERKSWCVPDNKDTIDQIISIFGQQAFKFLRYNDSPTHEGNEFEVKK